MTEVDVGAFGSDMLAPVIGGKLCNYVVRGLVVGRFMVRSLTSSERHRVVQLDGQSSHELARKLNPWVVHHIPSGLCWDYPTLTIALAVADDLSRYALHDPTCKVLDTRRLRAQLGAKLYDWADAIMDGKQFMPYRQELQFRCPEWHVGEQSCARCGWVAYDAK
jgi:hypothetical protein